MHCFADFLRHIGHSLLQLGNGSVERFNLALYVGFEGEIYLLSSDFMLSTNYMMITSSNDNLLALKSLYNTITNMYPCL